MPAKDTYGKFYTHTALDGQKMYDSGGTEKVYHDVVMVEIFVLGTDKTSRSTPVFDAKGEPIVAPDGETYIQKYPLAWKQFNRDDGYELDGTPLTNLHGIGPSQVINLGTKGVETVEQLAGLADSFVLGESGMVALRKTAQAYLAAMNPEDALAEKEEQAQTIIDLQRRLEQMEEQVQNQSKPRGRPKKAETA